MTADMMALREYQRETIDAVVKAWAAGMRRPAVVLPTGAGKSVITAHLANEYTAREGKRVLVLVHRNELALQAVAKLHSVAPHLSIGKVKAESDEIHADIVVASVQTLSRPNRLARLIGSPARPIGLVVHDECHHSASPSWLAVANAFSDAVHTGFTATLARGDGVGLGDVWEEVVYTRSVLWMVSKGFLVDARQIEVTADGLDLAAVKRSGGDYSDRALGAAMVESGVGAVIAAAYREHAADRPGIVFTPTVAAAHDTAQELEKQDIRAAVVQASTPTEERSRVYEASRTGEVQVIVNCGILTEGADFPWISCVVPRMTQSAGLWIQMAGRGLRLWPGKPDALILSIGGSSGRIRTLIDLEPGVVESIRPGESLAEAAVRTEEEGNRRAPAGSLAFALKHRELDLFAATGMNWLRTDAGVMFIPVEGGYLLLWPSAVTPGNWDVRVAPAQGRKFPVIHADLPMGTAMAWAETEADLTRDAGTGDLSGSRARWRKEPAGTAQLAKARGLGLTVAPGARKGDVTDLISVRLASMKFDRYVGVIA